MLTAAAAVAAVSAGNVTLSGDAVADFVVLHAASHLDDFSNVLVAYGHRGLDGVLRPLVPVVDVQVGAADGYLPYFDQYVINAYFRHRDVFHPDTAFSILLY